VTVFFESDTLLWQVRQQLLYPLNKRRELIWILLRKSFINLHGLFKCHPRLRWSVPGAIQNTQIVERRGDVRQISLRLFLRQLAVDFQRLLQVVLGALSAPYFCQFLVLNTLNFTKEKCAAPTIRRGG